MMLNGSWLTKRMYISFRHTQQIVIMIYVYVIEVEKLSAGMLTIDHLIKKCNSYLFLLSRIKVFYLEGTEYCFTTLTFYLILISIVLSGVTVVLH